MRPVELLPANSYDDIGAVLFGWLFPKLANPIALQTFEAAFAEIVGSMSVVTFSAGRVALAAILDALEIGPGDEVIVPGYTCVAVPNPVLFRGSIPIYADIEAATLNVSAATVEARISPRTRAIVVQHTFGYPAPMPELLSLARKHGIAIIEDCTHALGATLNGKPVGSFGDASFFSLEQTKMISAGTGGVAVSADPKIIRGIKEFHSRCTLPNTSAVRKNMAYLLYTILLRNPRWAQYMGHTGYYLKRLGIMAAPESSAEEMVCIRPASFEQQLSGAQARVATSQLKNLAENIRKRRKLALIYFEALKDSSVGLFHPVPHSNPSYVRFPVRVSNKARLHQQLARHGIQLGLWFTAPVHPVGVPQEKAGYFNGTCAQAEEAVSKVANLPCHPRMREEDALRVVDCLTRMDNA